MEKESGLWFSELDFCNRFTMVKKSLQQVQQYSYLLHVHESVVTLNTITTVEMQVSMILYMQCVESTIWANKKQ